MNTSSLRDRKAVYRLRLEQALRVMRELSANPQGRRFNISLFGRLDANGTFVGCIAGLCGLDPWFQEQGLVTNVENELPVNVLPAEFFGTEAPFYSSYYSCKASLITVERAIDALERAVAKVADTPGADARIVRVHIGPVPQSPSDPMPNVYAYFNDGTDLELFQFDPNELSFSETEFVGLTAAEAVALIHREDL